MKRTYGAFRNATLRTTEKLKNPKCNNSELHAFGVSTKTLHKTGKANDNHADGECRAASNVHSHNIDNDDDGTRATDGDYGVHLAGINDNGEDDNNE